MSVLSPSSLVGARSPIYITTSYGSAASQMLDVTLEVYIWNGSRTLRPAAPEYTLFRDVFAGANVSFDIAPMVREYLSNSYEGFDATTISAAQNDSVVWVQVDYDVNYLNKSVPPTSVNDNGSTSIFEVGEGYHNFREGANAPTSEGFLSSTPVKYVKDNGNDVEYIYLGEYGEGYDIYYTYRDRVLADGGIIEGGADCCNIGLHTIEVLTDEDYNIEFTVPESKLTDTQAESRILAIPSGVDNVDLWADSVGEPFKTAMDKAYAINLKDAFGNVLDTMSFEVVCEPKYTPVTIRFINKFGVWEDMVFFKRTDESIEGTSQVYQRSLGSSTSSGYSYDVNSHKYQKKDVNAKRKYVVNSGYVPEGYGDLIEQMLLSEKVMLDGVPVNVLTTSQTIKKSVNEKLIDYSIEFEEAFDVRYV